MKIKKLLLVTLLLPQILMAENKIINPTIKTPTSFAIIIDAQSYDKVKTQVESYRNVIEKDGLASYILVNDGGSPAQIREQIIALSSGDMPLEGVVFVGDIPIPMIRDAQYLSSAFKMDQKANWQKSSIPSDRYYDDFDLKFDLIKQDSLVPLYFYYTIAKESTHHINSDIYSARIKPLVKQGEDRYKLLAKYLDKVVKERSQVNTLDNMFVFRGHGYNSEAMDAWSGEQLALKEQLPNVFNTGNRIRFYDFEMRFPIKNYLLEQMQAPDVDVALCHHHGGPKAQYLTGYKNASDVTTSIGNVQRYLRSKVVDNKDSLVRIADFMKSLNVPRSWFDMSDSTKITDSIYNEMMDINQHDIYFAHPNARFVMLDACFNGAFHMNEYIAGAYIFSDGKTIVTQGNTVNTIQDKWPDQFVGLFDYGIRIGQWSKHVHFLETHLIGDPTYRFANRANPAIDINNILATKSADNKLWLKMLNSNSADIQAIALRKLSDNRYNNINSILKDYYKKSPYGVVRMECLLLLSHKHSPEFIEVLKLASNDSYELVRRYAINFISDCGHEELIPLLVKTYIEEELSTRINYYCKENIGLFSHDQIVKEFEKQYAEHTNLISDREAPAYAPSNTTPNKTPLDMIVARLDRTYNGKQEDMKLIKDNDATLKSRLKEINTFRNYQFHYLVPELITLAQDTKQDAALRVAIIEALGWFNQSYQYNKILAMCDLLVDDSSQPVSKEATKTKARLSIY